MAWRGPGEVVRQARHGKARQGKEFLAWPGLVGRGTAQCGTGVARRGRAARQGTPNLRRNGWPTTTTTHSTDWPVLRRSSAAKASASNAELSPP